MSGKQRMKRASSQPLLKYLGRRNEEAEDFKNRGRSMLKNEENSSDFQDYETDRMHDFHHFAYDTQAKCVSIARRKPIRRYEALPMEKYGPWRHEHKTSVARLEKQLKASWAIQELIDEQLNRIQAHYNHARSPTKLIDVAQLIMPNWAPARELATLTWLGDWRPSAILDLLRSLGHSSTSFPSSTTNFGSIEALLTELINEMRNEEAVIDEEMAEIQANCILHLPFGPSNILGRKPASALASIQSEFLKIHRVIGKAQNLRLKALELIVNKVLSHTDAAEFLVAFSGIQDSIHHSAKQHRLHNGSVSIPAAKALTSPN